MRRLIYSGREYVISATAIVFVSIPTTVAGCFSGGVRGACCPTGQVLALLFSFSYFFKFTLRAD